MHGGPINLKSAILPDASLRFASLLDADLQAADLTRADLVHARLDRANLRDAILKDAILDSANLAEADLRSANLTGASLKDARNLTQSQIDNTIGDETTVLPDYLEVPNAWLSPDPPPGTTGALPVKVIAAGAVALGIIWYVLPTRVEQPLTPVLSESRTSIDGVQTQSSQTGPKVQTTPIAEGPTVQVVSTFGSPLRAMSATASVETHFNVNVSATAGTRATHSVTEIALFVEQKPAVEPPAVGFSEPPPPLPIRKPAVAGVPGVIVSVPEPNRLKPARTAKRPAAPRLAEQPVAGRSAEVLAGGL
jgi:hypothetical protein